MARPGHHDGRTGILHEERGLRRRQLGRGGEGHEPGGERAEIHEDVIRLVAHPDHHPIAACEAEGEKAGGNAAHGPVRLGEGEAQRLAFRARHDERRLASPQARIVREAVAGGVETGR